MYELDTNRFVTSKRVSGSPESALQFALTTLTNQGFKIVRQDYHAVTLTGPGLQSTSQNPLLGASEIALRLEDRTLHLDAELGGVESMRRFITRFPLMLGLGMGVAFGVAATVVMGLQFGFRFGAPGAPGWKWLLVATCMPLLPVMPWIFLGPKMVRKIRQRTQDALETLVNNAALAAAPNSPASSRPA